MPKINNKFVPSRNMENFLKIFLDPNQALSKSAIAKEIGISVQSIYKWYRNPGFIKWLNTFLDQITENNLSNIFKAANRKANKGDFNFSRLVLEMSGKYTPRSESKNVNINKNDGLEALSEEDLIKGFKKDLDIYEANIKKQK